MNNPHETAPNCCTSRAGWLVVFVAAVLPVLWWPGDVSWTNDEPRLLAAAWHANHDRVLASGGLFGNFSLRYGPLPTHIYQALLALTHDPLILAVMRSAFCAGVTTFSLLWTARVLGLAPWFVVPLGLAPQVWQYQRVLWDASFAIPLGALALAATAAFFQEPARWRLLLAIGAAVLLPLIHPQTLPLTGAIVGMLWIHRRDELRRHCAAVVIVVGVVCILNAGYLVEVAGALVERLGGAVRSGYPAGQSRGLALLAPFFGGTLLGEGGFGGGSVPAAHLPAFWPLAAAASQVIHPLVWGGMIVAAEQAFHRVERSDARAMIAQVLLATLLLQALLFGLMRVPAEPQYFFGTFAVHALLAWLAVDAFRWKRLGLCLGFVYGFASAALTFGGIIAIHRYGYAAEPPRITLQNQVEIALALNRHPDSSVLTNVTLYQRYPQALRSLRLLVSPVPASAGKPSGKLVIRTVPPTPRIELAEAAEATLPPNFLPVDVTELPKGWQPTPGTPLH